MLRSGGAGMRGAAGVGRFEGREADVGSLAICGYFAKNHSMKVKHAILLLVVGFCCDFIGADFKILHMVYADPLFVVGMVLKVVGILLFAYKLFTYPKAKDFLNW